VNAPVCSPGAERSSLRSGHRHTVRSVTQREGRCSHNHPNSAHGPFRPWSPRPIVKLLLTEHPRKASLMEHRETEVIDTAVEIDPVTTRHTLRTPHGELSYKAEAGRIRLLAKHGTGPNEAPDADVFVVSYVVDDNGSDDRPVTFAFNGGPGSSSVWLHMGLLGPRRVRMGDAGSLAGPPYEIVDNVETILLETDIVFIDPVSTGYSEVAKGGAYFHYADFQRDVESVGEIIRLWTTRHERWLSPKLIAGESYGTTRACAVAAYLQERHGLHLNGMMLISSVIDFGTTSFTEGNDLAYVLALPTYAAIAHYHGLLGEEPAEVARKRAQELAEGEYLCALVKGARLTADERREMGQRLAAVTGLSPQFVDRSNLRVEQKRFFAELLRARKQTVGRLDGRFVGWEEDQLREQPTYDPSDIAIYGPYSAAINQYVRGELRYATEVPYKVFNKDFIGEECPWRFADFEGRSVSVSASLSEVMRHNNSLKVYVACGYYDGATPFAAAEYAFAHVQIPGHLRDNIDFRYYEAGHMMYVHEPSRIQQSADLAEFVRQSTQGLVPRHETFEDDSQPILTLPMLAPTPVLRPGPETMKRATREFSGP